MGLSCLPVCPPQGKESPFDGGDDARATTQHQLNSMLRVASLSLATVFVATLACKSSEKKTSPQQSPKKSCKAANRTNVRPSLSRVPDVVDICVRFRGDDNAFVISSTTSSDSVASDLEVPLTPITTRRQRRAHDTSECNYSDFCDNDLSRQIEAMALDVETTHANRRTSRRTKKTSSASEQSVAEKRDQAPIVKPSPEVVRVECTPAPAAENLDIRDTHCTPNKNSLHLLRQMFNKKLEDDVPAMRSCDSMSLSSSFSSRSSLSTLSLSPVKLSMSPMKKLRSLSPQPNAEWAIME